MGPEVRLTIGLDLVENDNMIALLRNEALKEVKNSFFVGYFDQHL